MDLDRLIATEQRLDEALRVAQEESARLVLEAQAAARRGEAELETELQAAARSFAAETAAERERREREVTLDAERQVARYEAVSPQKVAAAARDVVERLVAGATA
jgi:vacuolar-type H+-ATPase subunit H